MRFYNWGVNPTALPFLHRCLTLMLVGLLALGPFLHSHFGASHDTGFHLDGVHAVHKDHPSSLTPSQASSEESPALGVDASLRQSEDKGWTDLALLLAVLPLLPLLQLQRLPLPRAARIHHSPSTRYRAGLPPPCLAPPAL